MAAEKKKGPTGEERRPGSRAEAIRSAALEQFALHGYRASTMESIGAAAGIRGPSIYKHVRSKQDLLADLMRETMAELLELQEAAMGSSQSRETQLRRIVESHVRYHAQHRNEAFVGTREIDDLEEPVRSEILALRSRYERNLRDVIQAGVDEGVFVVRSPKLTSYLILDMGMGVAVWFQDGREFSADELAYFYSDMAIRLTLAAPST